MARRPPPPTPRRKKRAPAAPKKEKAPVSPGQIVNFVIQTSAKAKVLAVWKRRAGPQYPAQWEAALVPEPLDELYSHCVPPFMIVRGTDLSRLTLL